MATIGDLMGRARAILNESSARFWPDTDAGLLGMVANGLQAQHNRIKASVKYKPSDASPYWLNFRKTKGIVIPSGTNEVDLPADYDLLVAFMDQSTNRALTEYNIEDENILARGSAMGVRRGYGYYTFVASKKVRCLVWPGQQGTPAANRLIYCHYFRDMPRYDQTTDTVLIPDQFCTPAIYHAVASGMARERDDPTQFYQAFVAEADAIK
jgi:hypothetical protein